MPNRLNNLLVQLLRTAPAATITIIRAILKLPPFTLENVNARQAATDKPQSDS